MSYQIALFDTETTGLLLPDGSPLENQPHILEFACIKIDTNLNEVDRIEFMCNPGTGVPPIITKITGITDADIEGKPEFKKSIPELQKFFLGVKAICAHNLSFDTGMLANELLRAEKQHAFPWPPTRICTVEQTYHIRNRRMKLEQVYEHFFKEPAGQTHRAMDDVELLVKVFKKLVEKGIIEL